MGCREVVGRILGGGTYECLTDCRRGGGGGGYLGVGGHPRGVDVVTVGFHNVVTETVHRGMGVRDLRPFGHHLHHVRPCKNQKVGKPQELASTKCVALWY